MLGLDVIANDMKHNTKFDQTYIHALLSLFAIAYTIFVIQTNNQFRRATVINASKILCAA